MSVVYVDGIIQVSLVLFGTYEALIVIEAVLQVRLSDVSLLGVCNCFFSLGVLRASPIKLFLWCIKPASQGYRANEC